MTRQLRRIADMARKIPGKMGLREYAVTLEWSEWSGDLPGEGAAATRTLRVLCGDQNPKVRWASEKEIAIGTVPEGAIEIGPFTPPYEDGGYDVAAIVGSGLITGQTRYLTVTGPRLPCGARYRVTRIGSDHALRVTLTAVPAGV